MLQPSQFLDAIASQEIPYIQVTDLLTYSQSWCHLLGRSIVQFKEVKVVKQTITIIMTHCHYTYYSSYTCYSIVITAITTIKRAKSITSITCFTISAIAIELPTDSKSHFVHSVVTGIAIITLNKALRVLKYRHYNHFNRFKQILKYWRYYRHWNKMKRGLWTRRYLAKDKDFYLIKHTWPLIHNRVPTKSLLTKLN